MSAFKQYAVALLNLGYSPVPILPGEKRPLPVCDYYDHWNELREKALTPAQARSLAKQRPDLGLGVAGGYNCLAPVDFDMEEQEIKIAAARAIPRIQVAKVGKKGGTAFFWDSSGMIEACKFKRKKEDGGWEMLVEVLVTGQTVLPPTVHPETALPYRWVTVATLFNTKVDALPIITASNIEVLGHSLKKWTAKSERAVVASREYSGDLPKEERMRLYAKTVLKKEANELATFSQGRNLGIFLAASRVGKFMWHRLLTIGEVEKQLMDASQRNGYNSVRHGGKVRAFKSLQSGLRKARNDELPRLDA